MTKINSAVRTGIPQHNSKKAYLISIITILTSISQCWRYKKLLQAVHRRELTTSLEILVDSRIEENLEIFIIGNIKSLGGAI